MQKRDGVTRRGDGSLAVRVALGGASALALSLLWGVGIEPRLLDESHEVARVPGLPREWEGKLIAAMGDFQVGVWWANTGTVRKAIDRVMEIKPAALLLLGDSLYHPSPDRREAIDTVQRLLQPLQAARFPTYAVLGNHDYGLDDGGTLPPSELAEVVRRALRQVGITIIENSAVKLSGAPPVGEPEAPPLYLVGLGSHDAGDQDWPRAFAAVPEDQPRIVMMHNPHSFEELPAGSAPFAVAAHTHGGQIRIPFLPGRSWLARSEGAAAHVMGWAASEFGQPGNNLYVNRGIGFSGFPVRFGVRPELTIFRLSRG